MTDDATTGAAVDRLAAISTKMEREGRMTRYTLVICTAAILAVNAYIIRAMYNDVPDILLGHFMENMQAIVMTAKGYENVLGKTGGAPAPAPTTGGATGTSK